jgi:hypothetical protein
MAVLAGMSEAAGLLFAVGFLTPLAALAMATVMVVAVGAVHWKNGLWVTGGGFEYNLVLWTVAVAVAAAGPGRFSVDHAVGWAASITGLWWGLGVLGLSLLAGASVLLLRERQLPAEDTDAPLSRERDDSSTIVS